MLPQKIKNRLESIENLPTLPLVIDHLGRALRDPDADVDRVVGIIEDDPAIMARIMKVVNSSFYLGARKVVSLKQAIVKLGFQTVNNIAMSAAVFSTFPPASATRFNRTEFWRHCIYTGITAETLSSYLDRPSQDNPGQDLLHLCGLLHDIGKIVFEQFFHEQFLQALKLSQKEQVPLSAAETRVFGVNHAQAGAWLGQKWNLSEQVLEVIRWHHDPDMAAAKHRELVKICSLADREANKRRLGNSGNGYARQTRNEPALEFELDNDALFHVMTLVQEESSKSTLLMSFI
ncbi:MAG: HDOD domain-containing protein [Desulfohalobiaceae bacterium]|nr:HDOD domain-containing protein [Desulfohalobiaceae bacterium]